MEISVVVPALNEASGILHTLDSVRRALGDCELIVVDGGSTDGTAATAAAHAHVVHAARGRARQMNAGAAASSGDVLLFLHADTRLPAGVLDAIRAALADQRVVGGVFRLQFNDRAPMLRFYALCSRVRWKRLCFGDRGLFVRRAVFEALGGYPEIPIFEDLELARALHETGRVAFLRDSVTTSSRRFTSNGLVRQQLRNIYLWCRYMLGADPASLAPTYRYD